MSGQSRFARLRPLTRLRIGTVLAAGLLSACASDPALTGSPQLALKADTELGTRIGETPDVVVAGRHLHTVWLRRFYARHEFAPVWPARPEAEASLVAAISHAEDHGLDPKMFAVEAVGRQAALSPLDRELLLTDSFLSYALALSQGMVPPEHRARDEALQPDDVDIALALDDAIKSPSAGSAIEALAPTTRDYQALQAALRNLRTRSRIADRTAGRRRVIEVNLERLRWLPRNLPADRVWVNVAAQNVVLYQVGQPTFAAPVIVGQDSARNQSPEFQAKVDAAFLNPPWVVPRDIAEREILPKARKDPHYLQRNRMVVLANGDVEQLPGPDAGLGAIMFDMPNRFDVYLHDTPEKSIFKRANRRISHGCIRVENPRNLASLLFGEPVSTIDAQIAAGQTLRQDLRTPYPVFVVYQTAFVAPDGSVQIRPDFYKRDALIARLLHRPYTGDDPSRS